MSNNDITTYRLFKELEAYRLKFGITIEKMAFLAGVTKLAYKNWKNHATIPKAEREPRLRDLVLHYQQQEEKMKRYNNAPKKSNMMPKGNKPKKLRKSKK